MRDSEPSPLTTGLPGEGPALRNRLLALLPREDLALLAPHLTAVELRRGQILVEADQAIETAWFLESGIGSVIAVSPEGHRVEAAVFGRDAVAPAPLILGADRTPYQMIVQIAGHGHSISAAALEAALDASPGIRRLFGRYVQTLQTQSSYTALSNAIHHVDERCARWLLMVHDRVDGDDIPITHEFLSLMLAVRRPSVTTALHVLEGKGLIRAERGWVTIRNRAALEEFAGDAYGKSENEYRRLIGSMD